MLKEYKTILNEASAEYEEKKSRFIATVKPVDTEEEAQKFIDSLKSKYWDASHNVYAYNIGDINPVQRYSDAGEPSGTAGLPIMEVIKRMEVRNLVVVVTRYFGGTLLGAAGLVRSYTRSAAMGIEAAMPVRKCLCRELKVTIEYTLYGKVNSLILSKGYTINKAEFSQDVEISVFIPVDEAQAFREILTEAACARELVEEGELLYITLGMDGQIISSRQR